MLSAPPPGWIALQARAREAKNPEELADIIDEMNRLLSEYEKAAGDGHVEDARASNSRKGSAKAEQNP